MPNDEIIVQSQEDTDDFWLLITLCSLCNNLVSFVILLKLKNKEEIRRVAQSYSKFIHKVAQCQEDTDDFWLLITLCSLCNNLVSFVILLKLKNKEEIRRVAQSYSKFIHKVAQCQEDTDDIWLLIT